MALPVADELAYVDAAAGTAERVLDTAPAVNATSSSVSLSNGDLIVTGTTGSSIARFSRESGELEIARDMSEDLGPVTLWRLAQSSDGRVYVMGDLLGDGVVARLDPQTLRVQATARTGFGTYFAALDNVDRLWAIGSQSRSKPLSIVDLETMSATPIGLQDPPTTLVPDDEGGMIATIWRTGLLLDLSPEGSVERRLKVGQAPWGLAVADSTAVVSTHAPNNRPLLTFVDLDLWSVTKKVKLPRACPDPREVVIVRTRIVVACGDLPGVAIVDLKTRRVANVIRMAHGLAAPEEAAIEQPRGLRVVQRAAIKPFLD